MSPRVGRGKTTGQRFRRPGFWPWPRHQLLHNFCGPLAFQSYLLGSLMGDQVTSAASHLQEPLFFVGCPGLWSEGCPAKHVPKGSGLRLKLEVRVGRLPPWADVIPQRFGLVPGSLGF